MKNKLPFEKVKRKVLVKKKAETDKKFGKKPEERSVEESINYGVINILKPRGPTSHQTSDYVQKILGVDKAGHGGSLDPNVVGVLPIALGRATRVVQTLLKAGKEYVCLMHLHKDVDENEIKKSSKGFIGKIKQIPPVRSAVKRVEREREIYYLDVLEIDGRDVLFVVGCEAGTYIRKLCLDGDTNIVTNPIGSIKLKEFAEKEFKNFYGSKILRDNHSIISWKNNKLVKSNILKIQKLPPPKKMFLLKTQSGITLKITGDHEILIDTKKGPIWMDVKDIKKGDSVYSPRKINLNLNSPYIINYLDGDILVADRIIINKCKKALKDKFGTLYKGLKTLNLLDYSFHRNQNGGIKIRVIKQICEVTDLKWESLKKIIKTFKGRKGLIIKLRKPTINENVGYLIGLLMSDGHISYRKRPDFIRFFNKNRSLINKFFFIHKKEFGVELNEYVDNKGLMELAGGNFVLASLCYSLGITSNKKRSDINSIVNLPTGIIKGFLRGYFDGDGSCFIGTKNQNSRPSVTIHTNHYHIAKSLFIILKRLGIRSRLEKTNGFGGEGYTISMSSMDDKRRFINLVGTNHSGKLKKFKILDKKLHKTNFGDYDNLSVECSGLLKNLRKKYGMTRKYCSEVYCKIEKGKIRPERRTIKNILKKIRNKVDKEDICLNRLKSIADSDFYLEKITSKKIIKSRGGFVYDLTVKDTHNFCPEADLVVKNCHDIGEKLKTGAHLSQLVRTKAGPFTDADWKTLHDLKDAYEFWKEGNEKEIRKIILPMEFGVSHLAKIWVNDNCVDSLCHGADLSIPGVSKLESGIEKGNLLAIFSLKDELICLGNALIESEKVLKLKKGKFVKTTKVFMERRTYPKRE